MYSDEKNMDRAEKFNLMLIRQIEATVKALGKKNRSINHTALAEQVFGKEVKDFGRKWREIRAGRQQLSMTAVFRIAEYLNMDAGYLVQTALLSMMLRYNDSRLSEQQARYNMRPQVGLAEPLAPYGKPDKEDD